METIKAITIKSALFQIRMKKGQFHFIVNAPEEEAPIRLTNLKGLDIVLVEDERQVRLASVSLLENWGC